MPHILVDEIPVRVGVGRVMLEAHLGVPFQRYLLGHLDGIEPTDMRKIFGGRRRFKKGVFRHVYLHSVAETRVTNCARA